MNIIKFAMEMELDGIKYYQNLKSKYHNPSLNNIFDILIENEQEHYETCKKMLNKDTSITFTPTTILSDCANVFEELKKNTTDEKMFEIVDLLKHAMNVEQKSVKLYSDLADDAKTDNDMKIYEKMAGEEKQHYYILQNMAKYFGGDMDSSITNSEFEGWNVDGMY